MLLGLLLLLLRLLLRLFRLPLLFAGSVLPALVASIFDDEAVGLVVWADLLVLGAMPAVLSRGVSVALGRAARTAAAFADLARGVWFAHNWWSRQRTKSKLRDTVRGRAF